MKRKLEELRGKCFDAFQVSRKLVKQIDKRCHLDGVPMLLAELEYYSSSVPDGISEFMTYEKVKVSAKFIIILIITFVSM